MKILNAFSANMLAEFPTSVRFAEVEVETARDALSLYGADSCVGHADTAVVFSGLLGLEVPMARKTVLLEQGEVALLGQYSGPRLPEGSTALPEGAIVRWLMVYVGQ